jgi:hypothetical protein
LFATREAEAIKWARSCCSEDSLPHLGLGGSQVEPVRDTLVDVLEVLYHLALNFFLELSPEVLVDELIELLSVNTDALQLLILRKLSLDYVLWVLLLGRDLGPLLVAAEWRCVVDASDLRAFRAPGCYRVLL